jgi:hypothetical protein
MPTGKYVQCQNEMSIKVRMICLPVFKNKNHGKVVTKIHLHIAGNGINFYLSRKTILSILIPFNFILLCVEIYHKEIILNTKTHLT